MRALGRTPVSLFLLGLAAHAQAAPSAVIADGRRFTIRRQVTLGFFGAIYAGREDATGRRVAIKLLRPERDTEKNRTGLRNELWVAHRAIELDRAAPLAQAVALGTTDDAEAKLALVMEWVRGKPLGDVNRPQRRVSPRQAIELTLQVLRGLRVLHRLGWAHSDLHFGNVVWDRRRSARARLLDTGGVAQADAVWPGNVHQVSAPPGGTNLQADIFAAGAILKGLLTGRGPMESGPIPALAGAPGRTLNLREIVERAMAQDPSQRFQSVDEFIDALRPFARAS
jgi:serine/threonine protein kinase